MPALRLSRQRLQADLAESLPSSRRRARHGNRLITVEVALAMALVVGAVMLARSLRALTDLDLGFEPRNVLTLRLSLSPSQYPNVERVHAFHDRLVERVSALPGVEAVGLNNLLPVQMTYTNMSFWVEGWHDERPGHEPFAEHRTVNADFFRTMGIPIVAGRPFSREENRPGANVVVVSQRAAARYWPNTDPVGKRMAYGTRSKQYRWLTVVGVAGDILSAGVGQPPQAILYVPYRDFDFPIRSVSLIVRTAAAPTSIAGAVRTAVRELDPDLALYWMSTMEEVIARSTTGTRFLAVLLTAFSGLAVLLALVGVYGVMSYLVGQRHREIGVRIAMGASRLEVVQLVLAHGARRAIVGLAVGFLPAVWLGLAMRPYLIGIYRIDVVACAGAAVAVLVAALAASIVPAYRASRVDPIEALRHE